MSGCLDVVSSPWLCSREDTGAAAVTERGLVFEDFADKVDEVFVIGQDGVPAIPLTLKEAGLLNPAFAPPGIRPPFSLTLTRASSRRASTAWSIRSLEVGPLTVNWPRNPAWKAGSSGINVPS
jgi:hypothetical protein